MKFSENWLRALVDVPVDRAQLLQRLTLAGLEVEDTAELGGGLDGVVVAEIVAADPHPDADKLRVCRVDIGIGEPLQIVCGAPNARMGLKAPLATVGSTIGTITIKPVKLRGIESSGMLCSAKELGLDADASGLLELANDAPVGMPLAQYLGLPDAMIELGITPNRSDCLGMEGLAREVAAQFGIAACIDEVAAIEPAHQEQPAIRLEAAADCPRYCGRLVRGVDASAPTPLWMRERLRRAGIRPISALVDVTNYVMLETGQPLHAFDAAAIDGGIVVRRAVVGETLKLLDEREVALDGRHLVIADANQAIALAGVMGGFDSRVTSATRDVVLESAHFAPAAIAGRARMLGMHSDASHRFERGVDPALPRRAVERATALLLAIAGGQAGPVGEAVDEAHLPIRAAIPLRHSRIERVLGVTIDNASIERILLGLGMAVQVAGNGWIVTPPSRRFDIGIEEDLIEEIARIHGYGQIPTLAPSGAIVAISVSEARVANGRLREQLAARDYAEAITYAFVGADLLETWGLRDGAIALANSLSADLAVMRTSLLPGLVAALSANRNRQQDRVRLFEVGRSYHAHAAGIREVERVALAACGNADGEQWSTPSRAIDFFDIKGDIESLLALAGRSSVEHRIEASGPAWLHPGRAATLWRGESFVGHVGALHPRLLKALDIDADVWVAELSVDAAAARELPIPQPLSRFPSVRRDIAVVLPDAVPYQAIDAAIRQAVGDELAEVLVFDRYVGDSMPSGMKSVAIGLILQDHSRTLTDADADRCVGQAVDALGRGFGATLRG